ncbi:hypothetical protein HANVADRAFT_53969 [Hanseniaspora valbyensis NRRL Y-1626]|uniref:Suppressor of forked domain-containing protein n=1 Tax=Hanseniaspora valbyensis NRRL Y-1626 TaxID=766949 RepID=A0A1B7T9E0_9ASCO|nr:hypothetical protein HANVADRAFT_53969 [Hanseniaspora valbyensis NRRL Y-1626]
MSFYDVSELIIKEQIEQLVNVTIDPSTIPITQQQELLTKFDDLLEKYPLTLSLWQRYFNLYIYNLQHGSNLNENSTTQSGEIIDEKLNAKFTKAIQILKPNNFQIYDILLKYQLKNVNYVTGGKQALQSIIEQFVKIWDKSLSLNPFSTDHFQYIMTFVDLFQHWQVVNNDDLIIRNNTIRKHIIHFVSSSFYKDLEKVWKWFVNWDSNNAGSGEYKINQVSPIYMKMRSKYMQWESFYNSLANLNDFDRMTQCLNWETQHKQDYENLKIYQSRYKFIIQRFFHSKQFESEYVWDLLIHNSSNSGEYNQLFLYEKALQYMPRSLNLALRYSQALELKQGKQQSTIDTVDKMFKLLIDNTKKDQDLVSISGNFDNSLNAQLSIIFKKMLQENTRLKGVKGLRQAFKTFREFIKTEKCLLNYDIFITNCKYELQADARNMPICIKILSLGLNQYGKDNIENLNKYMLTTLNFVTEAGFTREHIKSYFETYKQSLNNNIKELCRENTGKTSGEVTIDKIPLELRKNILKVYKPWISYESGMNMGKYLNVESIYSEILKTIPGIAPVEIWELYSSQNSAEELLPKQEISNAVLPNIIKQQPQIILPNNLNMMEPVSVPMPDIITEHVELPAELFEVLLNLPKADTFKPMFDDAQLQSLATDLFGIMRDMNIEKFTYKE